MSSWCQVYIRCVCEPVCLFKFKFKSFKRCICLYLNLSPWENKMFALYFMFSLFYVSFSFPLFARLNCRGDVIFKVQTDRWSESAFGWIITQHMNRNTETSHCTEVKSLSLSFLARYSDFLGSPLVVPVTSPPVLLPLYVGCHNPLIWPKRLLLKCPHVGMQAFFKLHPFWCHHAKMAAAVLYNVTKMAALIFTRNGQKHWTTLVQTKQFGWD